MNLYTLIKNSKFLLLLTALLVSCGPSHMKYIGNDNWTETMSKSALTTGNLSYKTKYFLVKNALMDDYENDPKKVIKTLGKFIEHPNDKIIPGEDSVDEAMIALIELCTYQAQHSPDKDVITYWLSAAFYSYRYVFANNSQDVSNAYNALDLAVNIRYYNYALSKVYTYFAKNKISMEQPQGFPLIVGIVKLNPVKSDLLWSYTKFDSFINGYDYIPKNFQSHSYVAGLGVPILGLQEYNSATKLNKDLSLVSLVYPFTFLIKFDNFDPENQAIMGQPEFYDSFNDEYTTIKGQKVRLSKDFSLALGESLDAYDKINGIKYMFNPEEMGTFQGLYLMAPYNPDKIPVVLVHGLMAGPSVWSEMLNTLMSDQKIRDNYQFWLYTYPTGQPIYYSVYQFRQSLMNIQERYDPEKNNFYFNHMVLIGHSMGGLLTRIAVQDSEGFKLINAVTNTSDMENIELTEREKNFLYDIGIFKPIPFVENVILMATPNRGAEMANYYWARIGSFLISNPSFIKQNTYNIMKRISVQTGLRPDDQDIPNGIDSLTPKSKYLDLTLELPFNKNAEIHTIIGNEKKAGEKSGSDGVVLYSSAHLDNAQSETVVKSDHSIEFNPAAIKEVARILLEYLSKVEKEKNPDTSRDLGVIPTSTASDSIK
ncbi:MAG TPA: hypothetical protein DD381_04745 [Lentisphaeria bacterium]|nr:MAG: hypothetical protein A2X47_01655 [Lentisphaerae bacterium GWF2_38_69]HBM15639.1 hypothetical protein [Lentisphaeria bacterium]